MPILTEIGLRKSGTAIKFPDLERSFVVEAPLGLKKRETAI